jgi:hypothetical protein
MNQGSVHRDHTKWLIADIHPCTDKEDRLEASIHADASPGQA